ncbi:MAG: class I SAM-dependent methyltransferase [Alcaligenaceae bacterium]|nr:class I SAM-dependent methyltransferase [Alcaligenaceae bacterium]
MTKQTDNFWHQRFLQDSYFYGTQPNDFLKAQAHVLPKGGRVLSIGEGEGRNAVFLAEQGFDVTALDAAQSGLDKVQRLATERGVTVNTLCVDLNDYVFEPQQWDAIISIFCHLPPVLRARVHQGVVQALKPNGVFLLEAYVPKQLQYGTGGPKNLDLLYQASSLKQDLQGLNFILLEEVEREIYEGDGHHGLSAVVQLIAKKTPNP